MALTCGQVQVRDLLMGPGTSFAVLDEFNPFSRSTRVEQSEGRAWNHGAWSGVEWAAEVTIPIPIRVRNPADGRPGGWLAVHQQLAAAFQPVGELVGEVELRFNYDGTREYVMFGRPRMLEPTAQTARLGYTFTDAAFVALDPLIYSGALNQVVTGLPTFSGGLAVPFFVPFTVDGAQVGGRAPIVNEGTADTGLFLRLDGPLDEPRVTLQQPDGSTSTLRFDIELSAGQWLEVDTAAETVFLNGLPQSSQLGRTAGEFFKLRPGTSTLRFAHTGDHNPDAQLTVTYRDAWW